MTSAAASVSAPPRIHETAIVEDGVTIGSGTSVWDNVHVRGPSVIGRHCIIGEKTYIAYGVNIGDYVKINAQVYVCTAVTIEDRVMVSAGVIFTNDRYPRAFDDSGGLAFSGPTEETLATIVREGVTLGAGAIIGPGIEIGRYAMVGMGSVVAANVAPYALVYGNPARLQGYACVCGTPILSLRRAEPPPQALLTCERCRRMFRLDRGILREAGSQTA